MGDFLQSGGNISMNDWRDEMGLIPRKTKAMWELNGYCAKCEKPHPKHSQAQRRRLTNHTVKYWINFYENLMDNDDVIRCAFGFMPFIDSVAEGELIDMPESPYAAARLYRQSEGLLRAIYGYFGMGGLEESLRKLQSNPIFDPDDEWWFENDF